MGGRTTSKHEREGLTPSEVVSASRVSWHSVFESTRRSGSELELRQLLQQSTSGGSGSFLAVASDGLRYWVKPLNNTQMSWRICVTEQIVGRVGACIGAPTCTVRTVGIPKDLAGWEFRPGARLEPGIAHASKEEFEEAVEEYALGHRADDANASRHAYIAALWDLCWGSDPQWLRNQRADNEYWSHDHGMFLPGANLWSEASLTINLSQPHPWQDPTGGSGLSQSALLAAAERLLKLDMATMIRVLAQIPREWPVDDAELEAVGDFIVTRAPAVAARLLQLAKDL